MWKTTAEGRRLLNQVAESVGGRAQFGLRSGVGRNQVKPILDDPNYTFKSDNLNNLRLICREEFAVELTEGKHYLSSTAEALSEIKLARDQVMPDRLNQHDRRGIELLYEALLKNPRFPKLRPTLDSLEDFKWWFDFWGHGQYVEQFFVYRLFRESVIAFLYGERCSRRPNSFDIFAIWYLVGINNTCYEGSPVRLTNDDLKQLPVGERETTANLTIRLLEEFKANRGKEDGIDLIVFEVAAEDFNQPDSLPRSLLRAYARAEDDVKRHFAGDQNIKNTQFFVLNFPYMIPRTGPESSSLTMHEVTDIEHYLVCCPLKPALINEFKRLSVRPETVEKILEPIYLCIAATMIVIPLLVMR